MKKTSRAMVMVTFDGDYQSNFTVAVLVMLVMTRREIVDDNCQAVFIGGHGRADPALPSLSQCHHF